MLVLFDIDGTLLMDDGGMHARALTEAMRHVYVADLSDDAVERAAPWGKTDLQIAREVLRAHGLDDENIDRGVSAWARAASDRFAELAAVSSVPWRHRSDLPEALKALADVGMRLALLTGNLRAIATTKVKRIGVAPLLDLAVGAYGDDAEQRGELAPIARRRAGGGNSIWPRERTVIVGDTPADIAAARSDEIDSVLFSSTRYPDAQLTAATVVVADVWQMVRALHGLRSAAQTS